MALSRRKNSKIQPCGSFESASPITHHHRPYHIADCAMIIYRDIFSGAELFSDTYPVKLIDDLYDEVEGKVLRHVSSSDSHGILAAYRHSWG